MYLCKIAKTPTNKGKSKRFRSTKRKRLHFCKDVPSERSLRSSAASTRNSKNEFSRLKNGRPAWASFKFIIIIILRTITRERPSPPVLISAWSSFHICMWSLYRCLMCVYVASVAACLLLSSFILEASLPLSHLSFLLSFSPRVFD